VSYYIDTVSMNNEYYNFNDVDPLYISAALTKIERSFNITIDNESLENVTTFNGLCDLITNRIKLENSDSCSTQHAFYMLRCAIAEITGIDKCEITPHTRLSKIFPRESRLRTICEIEEHLGFNTNLLQPKQWVITLFSMTLLISIIGLFYNWEIAAAGILASAIGLKLAGKFGKEIHLKTVGDMANKISRQSIVKARHASGAMGKNNVEQKLKEILANDIGWQPVVLTRKSPF
jgi:hypothetical protein